MTQADCLLRHLKKHQITTMEAYQKYGITRLASRIYDLRKEGYEIVGKMMPVKTRYGSTTVKRYKLK